MSCFNPIDAWRLEDQTKLSFIKPKNEKHVIEKLQVPCGHCIGCLLDRANEWATRCYLESKNWKNNCFITLTYNEKSIPEDKQLHKEDLQKFWKRLRYYEKGKEYWENPRTGKHENPIRYYSCGEYGTKNGRPHFHACIFNWKPDDLKFYKFNHEGDPLYTSKKLNKIWGKGYVIIGNLNYKSACYVARYVTKKLYGQIAKIVYKQKKPEFTESSRNGGIGILAWIKDKLKIVENKGIYVKTNDTVKLKKIPKFFLKKWQESKEYIGEYDYDMYIFEQTNIAKLKMAESLKKTTLNESEYKKLLEKNLIEKTKILKRNKTETA